MLALAMSRTKMTLSHLQGAKKQFHRPTMTQRAVEYVPLSFATRRPNLLS
jgi:hypothetical protein